MPDPNELYQRNSAWADTSGNYLTQLPADQEAKFQDWVKANKVPFDPSPTADYDMRGFWQGLQTGDPHARTGINPNDSQLHYSDYWKTPYHQSFSAESKFAKPGAPRWNARDQLVTPDGRVVYDERAAHRNTDMPDLTQLPGQPKVFGAPMGPEAHVEAPDRNKPTPATDAQVKAAYQAYMRQVMAAAHAHFEDHLKAQGHPAVTPQAAPSAQPAPARSFTPEKGGIPRVDKAVQDAGT